MRAALWLLPVAALLAGCGHAGHTRPAAKGTTGRNQPTVYAPGCAQGAECRSPDDAWSARVVNSPAHSPGQVILTRSATGKRTVGYSSYDECCGALVWIPPHRLFF